MALHDLSHIWPEWKIEKQIGKGSYGVVYQAVRNDNNVTSSAAIKVISIPSDPAEVDSLRAEGLDESASRTYFKGVVDDFVNEIQLMESFKGIQNIVSVEDYKVVEKSDVIGWDIYIRMELLTPLSDYLSRKKLTEEDVIKLGVDICTALEICGKQEIIHRDIKPENIFVNKFGHFKLGDFGVARKLSNVSGNLSQKGTPNYMAPEVTTGTTYDARVDVYSLGIVLYRLLNANRLPLLTEAQMLSPTERQLALERRMRGEELPPPCDASPELASAVLKACAFDPNDRFAGAQEMREALESVRNGTYVPILTDLDKTRSVRRAVSNSDEVKKESKPAKQKKSRKWIGILAIVLALALLGGIAFAVVQLFSEEDDWLSSVSGDSADDKDKDKDKDKGQSSNQTDPSQTIEPVEPESDEIAAIIEEADAIAQAGNIEEAIAKIEEGIGLYPESKALQDKLEVLNETLALQAVQQVLDEAAALANKGDYLSAMSVIQNAQNEAPERTEYQSAYNDYRAAYIDAVVTEADALAANNDFDGVSDLITSAQRNISESSEFTAALAKYSKQKTITEALNEASALNDAGDPYSALEKVRETIESVGEDSALTSAAKTYENAYVQSVLSAVNNFVSRKNYTSALSVLNDALTNLPGNTLLTQKVTEITQLQEADKNTGSNDNPNQNPVLPTAGSDVDITGVSTLESAVLIQRENINHASFKTEGNVDWYWFTTSVNYSSYRLEFKNNSIDTTIYIKLFDEYQNELGTASAGKGGTAYLDVVLDSNTEYWIEISRYYSNRLGNYQFTVSEKICDAGIDRNEAFTIDTDVINTKSLDVFYINDWYTFKTSDRYSTYQFYIKNNNVDCTLYLTVFDEYDTELGAATANKGATGYLDLILEANKEYKIQISRRYGDRTGNYQFSANEMVCDAGLTQKDSVSLVLNQTHYGVLDTSFEDWYAYTFTETKEYTLSFTNNNINTTAYVTVYDVLGTELVVKSANKGDTATHTQTIEAGTVLYLKITRRYADQNGNYMLSING